MGLPCKRSRVDGALLVTAALPHAETGRRAVIDVDVTLIASVRLNIEHMPPVGRNRQDEREALALSPTIPPLLDHALMGFEGDWLALHELAEVKLPACSSHVLHEGIHRVRS